MAAFRSRFRPGGRRWALGAILALAPVALVFAVTGASAATCGSTAATACATPTGPIGVAAGFEDNDGNMEPNALGINFDWNNFAGAVNGNWEGTAPYQDTNVNGSTPVTLSGWQFLGLTDAAKSNDSSFVGGTKQDNNCPGVSNGSMLNKDDLSGAYIAAKTVNGHVFLMLAWKRIPQNTTSASAHVAFEFNQSKTTCPAGSDGLVQRTAGDMLIVYDFTGGTTISVPPTLSLSRWITPATGGTCQVGSDSPPCWGTFTTLPATVAEANVDTGAVCQVNPPAKSSTSPCLGNSNETSGFFQLPSSTRDCVAAGAGNPLVSGFTPFSVCSPNITSPTSGGDLLGTDQFGEAGVDLTNAGVFGAGSCESFGKVEAISRSSGDSNTAAMEDLVGPGTFKLSNCNSSLTTTPQDSTGHNIGTSGISITTAGSVMVQDSAQVSVTGTNTWAGSLSFFLCGPSATAISTCTSGTGSQIGSSKTVDNNTTEPVTSATAQLTSAGFYCWAGVFTPTTSGVPPASDTTSGECFQVTPVTPTLTTNSSNQTSDTGAILGTSISDTASLSGTANRPGSGGLNGGSVNPTTAGSAADGTLTFTAYGPFSSIDTSACTSANQAFTTNDTVSGDSSSTNVYSASFTPSSAGIYLWVAHYGGDSPNTNAASDTSCGDPSEVSFVNTAPTAISTRQFFFPQDKAQITATAGGNIAGSVEFRLFDNQSDCLADNGTLSATGLVFHQTIAGVTGTSTADVTTSNSDFRVSSSTASNLYWTVLFTSTNNSQKNSSSVCTENMEATLNGDDTSITFP
jgi:hypothetical protein